MTTRRFLAVFALAAAVTNVCAQQRALDTTIFLVTGGGLSAGVNNSIVAGDTQKYSYPAQMAGQMNALMPLPVFRDGGPVTVISWDKGSKVLPRSNQSTLRALPFDLFTFNLSVPFLKISEGLKSRPRLPIAIEGDYKQSMINLILGYPGLTLEDPPFWSQIEYAEIVWPTFVMVEMGFGDVVDAVLFADTSRITPAASFSADYGGFVKRLKATFATVLLMTVPDPTDAAFCFTPDQVAGRLGTSREELRSRFGIQANDLVTLGGVIEIGERITLRRNDPLSKYAVLKAADVATIQAAVRGFNSAITSVASASSMKVFDLNAFFAEVRAKGVQAGSIRLGGGYMEGFYSGDGLFPGTRGNAVLANRLLTFVNGNYGTNYPPINLDSVPQNVGSPVPLQPGFESLGPFPRISLR